MILVYAYNQFLTITC